MPVTCARILRIALVVVSLSYPGQTASIAQSQEGRWATAVDASREAIRAMMERSGTPGLSVAVAAGGEIVWSEGFGYADLEHLVAVTPETRFGIDMACSWFVRRGELDGKPGPTTRPTR